MDSENPSIQSAPESMVHEAMHQEDTPQNSMTYKPRAASNRRRSFWLSTLGWVLIPLGIVALAVWVSGQETRQIRAWGQKGDVMSLSRFLSDSAKNALLDSATIENQKLAWAELMRIAPDAKGIDLEALFYAMGPNHPLSPVVVSRIGNTQHSIRDIPRFAEIWLLQTDSNGNQARAMEAIIQSSGANIWNSPLRTLVGRAYGEGNLVASIQRANRLAALGLDPANIPLKEALEQSGGLRAGICAQQASIRDLDPKISELEVVLEKMSWPTLTAFLVDRVPALGDNVYEIGTFHWNGWELERDETAILTCSEMTFSTKGRFTMAVHPTGTKAFTLQNGRSVSVPTFTEVTRAERAQQMEARIQLGDLKSRRSQAQRAIQAAEAQLEGLNHRIKQLLGWEKTPSQA